MNPKSETILPLEIPENEADRDCHILYQQDPGVIAGKVFEWEINPS